MSIDDICHIVHATVADFNCIAVENFVKFAAFWKTFCYQLKECLCDVCWNGFAKGWVKPYYVLLSPFCFSWFVVGVFQINIITRIIPGLYRDDGFILGLYRDNGLVLLRNLNYLQMEKKRKTIINIFKVIGFSIEI